MTAPRRCHVREPQSTSPEGASLRFEFRPHIGLITTAREFVTEFYGGVLSDPDAVFRVALATHELLENVLKYSLDGRGQLGIEVLGAAGSCFVCIRVRNRATPEHAYGAERLIAEINAGDDPFLMYQRFVRRSATHEEGSGLGLARISAEAELDVRCQIDGDHLTITAEGPVLLVRKP